MIDDKYKNMFDAVFAEDQKLGIPRDLAKHISRVSVHGLTGLDALHPNMQPLCTSLLACAKTLGANIRVVETFRTWKRQNDLFALGRTQPGAIVTKAKGGQSYHNYGLAFDIYVMSTPAGVSEENILAHLGTFAESIGMVWGGTFGDYGHFEYHPGFVWQDIITYFID